MNLGLARSLLVYHGQPWKRARMRRMYAAFVGPGDLCVDGGAHVGNRVGCFRRLGARVVAVEPNPDCVGVLRWLYGRDPGVTIAAVGLGAEEGRAVLHASSRHPTVSSTSPDWIAEVSGDPSFAAVRWDRRLEIDVTTLDALVRDHGFPAFVKLDVEGSEPDVLAGLSIALAALSFEVVPAAKERGLRCLDRLAELGEYGFLWSPAETHAFAWDAPAPADRIRSLLEGLAPGDPSGDVYAVRSDRPFPRHSGSRQQRNPVE